MLTGLSKKYTSQLSDRGAKMKWPLGKRARGPRAASGCG